MSPFSKYISFIIFFLLNVQVAYSQNMYPTDNGNNGIGALPAGWWNSSIGNGTPDASTTQYAITPFCPWDRSPTDRTHITLPASPTGASVFADVFTCYPGYNEKLATSITNLITGHDYTVRIYLITCVSSVAVAATQPSDPVFFPTSISVIIDGNATVLHLDSTTHNQWKLFTISFRATGTSAIFDIGLPQPQTASSGGIGGGGVCISVGADAVSCSNKIDLGGDKKLCAGGSVFLQPNITGNSYIWQDSSTNDSYTASAPGLYSVTTFTNNCWSSDSINISYQNIPAINLTGDTALCQGETLQLDASTVDAAYVWQDSSTNSNFNVSTEGVYWVRRSINSCSASDTVHVTYKNPPNVNLGDDTTLCYGKEITLNGAAPNASYTWQDNSANAVYKVNKPGSYWVKATKDGCSNSDTVNVSFEYCDCTPFIRNAFTPNGDGTNDTWVISYESCPAVSSVSVYNRYGSLVYYSKDYRNDWKGTYNNNPCPDATYYYVVMVTHPNGRIQTVYGDVTILR